MCQHGNGWRNEQPRVSIAGGGSGFSRQAPAGDAQESSVPGRSFQTPPSADGRHIRRVSMITHLSERPVRRCARLVQLGAAIVVLAAFSSPTGCGGSTNASAPEAGMTGAAAPDSGSDSGSSGSDSSTTSNGSTDCTPVAWGNPGKVENPVVMKVAVDAGTQGHEFGRSICELGCLQLYGERVLLHGHFTRLYDASSSFISRRTRRSTTERSSWNGTMSPGSWISRQNGPGIGTISCVKATCTSPSRRKLLAPAL